MSQRRKSTSRSNEGITLTISIRAKDEKAAKRILEHPTLKGLVEAFEAEHALGGQDPQKRNPFVHFTKEDFLGDVHLRSRALKWLEDQDKLDPHDTELVIKTGRAKHLPLGFQIFNLLVSNLPELAAVYQIMAARMGADGKGITIKELKESFGYKDFRKNEISGHLNELREMIRGYISRTEHITPRADIEHKMVQNLICVWEGNAFGSTLINY